METKKCKDCGQVLPVTEFGQYKTTKDKLNIYCKKCIGVRNRAHYAKKKEKLRAYGDLIKKQGDAEAARSIEAAERASRPSLPPYSIQIVSLPELERLFGGVVVVRENHVTFVQQDPPARTRWQVFVEFCKRLVAQ